MFMAMESRGFYGKFTMTYQNGKVVNVKKEESIKVVTGGGPSQPEL